MKIESLNKLAILHSAHCCAQINEILEQQWEFEFHEWRRRICYSPPHFAERATTTTDNVNISIHESLQWRMPVEIAKWVIEIAVNKTEYVENYIYYKMYWITARNEFTLIAVLFLRPTFMHSITTLIVLLYLPSCFCLLVLKISWSRCILMLPKSINIYWLINQPVYIHI